MTSGSHFFVEGRKHKIPRVDLDNPFLRAFLEKWPAAHCAALNDIRRRVRGWVKKFKTRELADASKEERLARPLAAVLDIDEVLLCNIHPNSRSCAAPSESFSVADVFGWPRECKYNPLMPGAFDLLAEMRACGLCIFLVTGRVESVRDETIENFVKVGLCAPLEAKTVIAPAATVGTMARALGAAAGCYPFKAEELAGGSPPSGALIMCPDAAYPPPGKSIRPYKESCRKRISETHRIIANIGDQASDLGLYGDMQILTPHPFYWVA